MINPLDKTIYKFGAEGFLSMFLSKYQFVLGADLEHYADEEEKVFDEENPCHIYFVLKRPKITIDPDSFECNEKKTKFNLIIHQKNGYGVINMGAEFSGAKSELKLLTEYPYNLFAIGEEDRLHMVARPSSLIDSVEVLDNIQPEILDYEVLYIGQAYGKNGSRTAIERLASHETLQKIYTHALTQNPESDIWIMLTRFSQVSALFAFGSNYIENSEENEKQCSNLEEHFFDNKGFNFSQDQKINFTEAALIRYFEPRYNIEFKNSFPNKNHKSYSECYKLDIRALNIEVDTTENLRKLYTDKVRRKSYHSTMFEFKNDNDRLSLLYIYK